MAGQIKWKIVSNTYLDLNFLVPIHMYVAMVVPGKLNIISNTSHIATLGGTLEFQGHPDSREPVRQQFYARWWHLSLVVWGWHHYKGAAFLFSPVKTF